MRRRTLTTVVAGTIAATAAISVGVATATPTARSTGPSPALIGPSVVATIPPSAPTTTPSTVDSPTTTPSAVIVSTYSVAAATGPSAFVDEQVTLAPIVGSPPSVTAAQAYTIARGSGPLPYVNDLSGSGTATLYAYSNSAAGAINSDGSTTLEYQSTPAWVFSFPLAHYVDFSAGGAATPGGRGFPKPTGTNCSWISIVDASKAELIEAFESCAG